MQTLSVLLCCYASSDIQIDSPTRTREWLRSSGSGQGQGQPETLRYINRRTKTKQQFPGYSCLKTLPINILVRCLNYHQTTKVPPVFGISCTMDVHLEQKPSHHYNNPTVGQLIERIGQGSGQCGSIGWSIVPCTEGLQIQFSVRAHAQVASRGACGQQLIEVSLSPFLSL